MDLIFKIALFSHLTALAFGTAANVVMPLVGAEFARAEPSAMGGLGRIAGKVQIYSKIAIAVLLISGFVMLFLRYGGDVMGLGPWFIAKMVMVVALLGIIAVMNMAPKAINPKVGGIAARLLLLGIIASAVISFN